MEWKLLRGFGIAIFFHEAQIVVADVFDDGNHGFSLVSQGVFNPRWHFGKSRAGDQAMLATVKAADFDAVFISGGQGPIYTFYKNKPLYDFIPDFWQQDKFVVVICHATCILLGLKLPNCDLLVKDKTWTGFADAEEAFEDGFVGQRIQPFRIETEARKLPETNFITGGLFKAFALRDGRLITGQQQFSCAAAADVLIDALGK